MALLIIGRSVENAGALQYHSAGSIPVEAFRKTCKRTEMEISEIRDYVSNEFEKAKQIMEGVAEYYVQSDDKEDDIGLVQFYNGMVIAYNNVLKTIDDSLETHQST